MMARSVFARRSRRRWTEIAFWLAVVVSIVVFPTHLILITQLLIVGLFAASFDLLVGYTGIASLGHAAFFGIGAYAAGILIHAGWTEPISGLAVAGIAAGAFGLVVSALVAQLSGPALLMITLGLNLLVFEAAHTAKWLTGGDDGLAGVVPSPVLGLFAFDLYGRTAVVYTLVVVALCYLVLRRVVHSPFGLQLEGIRENARRAPALGISIRARTMAAFTVSAFLAGIAGALLAQVTQTVALGVLSFDRSAAVLIIVMLGGLGTLIGGFIGAAVYTIAQDRLSSLSPVYWNFWIGLMLVLFVLFARGGIVGALDRLGAAWRKRRSDGA
jgi:branched-chain amino acid transport system permease protein